jgi:hypothetical protein
VTRCLPGGARAERGAAGSRRATGAAREHARRRRETVPGRGCGARRRRETVRRRESGLTSVKVLQISRRTRMMNQIRKQKQIICIHSRKLLIASLFSLLSSLFSLLSSLFALFSSLFLSPSRALTLVSRSPPHHWAIEPLRNRGLMAPAVARPVDCSRARKRDEIKTESRAA